MSRLATRLGGGDWTEVFTPPAASNAAIHRRKDENAVRCTARQRKIQIWNTTIRLEEMVAIGTEREREMKKEKRRRCGLHTPRTPAEVLCPHTGGNSVRTVPAGIRTRRGSGRFAGFDYTR